MLPKSQQSLGTSTVGYEWRPSSGDFSLITDPNSLYDGRTLLMHAVLDNDNDKVKKMLEGSYPYTNAANPNIQSASHINYTALMYAVSQGNKDVARALIAKGANQKLQDQLGETALIIAAQVKPDMIPVLLEDPNVTTALDIKATDKDKYGYTALMYAVGYKYNDAANALINKGARIDITNKNPNENIVVIAKAVNNQEFLKYLREKGLIDANNKIIKKSVNG